MWSNIEELARWKFNSDIIVARIKEGLPRLPRKHPVLQWIFHTDSIRQQKTRGKEIPHASEVCEKDEVSSILRLFLAFFFLCVGCCQIYIMEINNENTAEKHKKNYKNATPSKFGELFYFLLSFSAERKVQKFIDFLYTGYTKSFVFSSNFRTNLPLPLSLI